MQTTSEITVKGKVQGVGYRYFTAKRANEIGLKGFVKNQPDGDVILRAQGNKSDIETLIGLLKIGPRLSHVDSVNVQWLDSSPEYSSFSIKY